MTHSSLNYFLCRRLDISQTLHRRGEVNFFSPELLSWTRSRSPGLGSALLDSVRSARRIQPTAAAAAVTQRRVTTRRVGLLACAPLARPPASTTQDTTRVLLMWENH